MAETPPISLKDYASELRKQADFFAGISEYVELPALEFAKMDIQQILSTVSPNLGDPKKQSFDHAVNEAILGIKALIRSIHRDKDTSKQFFKDAIEVANYLRSAASLLSLLPTTLFVIY